MTNDPFDRAVKESNQPDTDEDHQAQAIEACEHAIDALHAGELSRAGALLDEAHAAVEHARPTEVGTQAQRETAWDCYD